jgi:hypothetical protein
MKKIILLAVIVIGSLSLNAQRVWTWTDSINVGAMVAADTIKQPHNSANQPSLVGSYPWSCEVDAESLSGNNAKFEIGGGNTFMRNSEKYYKFMALSGDSIPKTLNRTALSTIVRNGGIVDTIYVFGWKKDRFNFDVPMVRVTDNGATGWVRWTFKFYKQ